MQSALDRRRIRQGRRNLSLTNEDRCDDVHIGAFSTVHTCVSFVLSFRYVDQMHALTSQNARCLSERSRNTRWPNAYPRPTSAPPCKKLRAHTRVSGRFLRRGARARTYILVLAVEGDKLAYQALHNGVGPLRGRIVQIRRIADDLHHSVIHCGAYKSLVTHCRGVALYVGAIAAAADLTGAHRGVRRCLRVFLWRRGGLHGHGVIASARSGRARERALGRLGW